MPRRSARARPWATSSGKKSADGEAVGAAQVHAGDGARGPRAGGVPAALGVQEPGVGGEVPGRVDGPGDAVAAGADEEDRPEHPGSPTADPELVPSQGRGLGRGRGGLNKQGKLVTRKSYDFRTAEVAKLALLHNLGHLPEPKRTHRFC
jgi:hypothetical protein